MLLLLDSAGLYFRAFHGAPESITAPDGHPANALRGFLDMTAALVASRRPSGLVACWDDSWRPAWRVALVPSYKTHRAEPDGGEVMPGSLPAQADAIAEVLAALGIVRVGAPDYEADDVMATLARRHAGRGEPVEVVSGDRDMLQLVDDALGIRVLYTARGIRRVEVVDEAAVRAAHGVGPRQYVDLAVLRGDSSDGLPGVAGIGARTGAALLARFGDLDTIRAAAGDPASGIRPGVARAIVAAADYLDRAVPVVRVADAIPLPEVDHALPTAPADPAGLAILVERWGIQGPVDRLLGAIAALG